MIRNMTGREIVIFDDNNNPSERLQPDGNLQTRTSGPSGGVVVDKVDGIPVVDVALNRVNLPDPEKNTSLVTHLITAQAAAAQGRRTDDLLIPSSPVRLNLITNEIIKNEDEDDGNCIIIGWRQLARLPK